MNESLLEQALQMSPAERVSLAELLLASIDHENDDLKDVWVCEVKERMKAVSEGRARLVDLEELIHESSAS